MLRQTLNLSRKFLKRLDRLFNLRYNIIGDKKWLKRKRRYQKLANQESFMYIIDSRAIISTQTKEKKTPKISVERKSELMTDNRFKIKISDITENEDGSANMTFDLSDEFCAWFKEIENLKRWSPKRFEKWVLKALEHKLQGDK